MTFLCQHETDTVFVATSANISAEGSRLQKKKILILKLKTSPGIPESSPRSIYCLLFPTPTYNEYNSHTV